MALTPAVPALPQALKSERVQYGNIVLNLQLVSWNAHQATLRPGETQFTGILSRAGKRQQAYFIASVRNAQIASLDIFEVMAPEGYVQGHVSVESEEGAGGAPLPIVFLSCYLIDLLNNSGLCR